MNSELSFEICKEAVDAGVVLRYDIIEYRGNTINFLSDVTGEHVFAQWGTELIDLGLNNIYYKEDVCRLIDRRLDLIETFRNSDNFIYAKLEWFNNGGCRDIRLVGQGRILKVFLVVDPGTVKLDQLINESKIILDKLNTEIC